MSAVREIDNEEQFLEYIKHKELSYQASSPDEVSRNAMTRCTFNILLNQLLSSTWRLRPFFWTDSIGKMVGAGRIDGGQTNTYNHLFENAAQRLPQVHHSAIVPVHFGN